jgi:site-specific recombinase XerD
MRHQGTTFAALCDDMLKYSANEKKSVRSDRVMARKLLPTFGPRVAADIKPQEISDWLDEHTRTSGTRNRYRACLSLIYRQGIRNGKVAVNPARLVRQRTENNARQRFLSTEEIGRLRAVIAKHFQHHLASFDVGLNTGMRSGEQFMALRWCDVHLERRQISLTDTKNGGGRVIPLNKTAFAAFLEARKQWDGNPNSRVFLSVYGKPLNSPRWWFIPAIKLAKLEGVTWHTLRHTYISHLVMKGIYIRTVAELAGHKTLIMTMRYAHLAPGHLQDAVERLDRWDTKSDTGTFEDNPEQEPMSSKLLN